MMAAHAWFFLIMVSSALLIFGSMIIWFIAYEKGWDRGYSAAERSAHLEAINKKVGRWVCDPSTGKSSFRYGELEEAQQ